MDIEKLKLPGYKKNGDLESLLTQLNGFLAAGNDAYDGAPPEEDHPMLFVVGCPRSGTTLLTQWLASLETFCYPTNFMSRFHAAPWAGALIQEMLFNPRYRYKNELEFAAAAAGFSSDVGKTTGPLGPHEFWYFWRNFFQFPEVPVTVDAFEKNARFAEFAREIRRVQGVFHKPFFIKALIINPYIASYNRHLQKPLFLHIKRDPLENMQSLLETRVRYLGSEEHWFSFKPAQYSEVQHLDSYRQAAAQVLLINREIERGLDSVPAERRITIDYRDFCSDTGSTLQQLRTALRHYGHSMPAVDGASTQIRYRPKEKRGDHHRLAAAWEAANEMFKQDLGRKDLRP